MTSTQRIAIAVAGIVFLAQLWRTCLAWLQARRIEKLERITWQEHTARSLTARRYPPFHPEQS